MASQATATIWFAGFSIDNTGSADTETLGNAMENQSN
jgi:hypothetical protein